MSRSLDNRNLDNVRRLFSKLQLRYGDGDALVLQVKKELDAREALDKERKQWSIPYREFIKLVAGQSVDTKAGLRAVSTTTH